MSEGGHLFLCVYVRVHVEMRGLPLHSSPSPSSLPPSFHLRTNEVRKEGGREGGKEKVLSSSPSPTYLSS